jgi:hypothetical protein
MSHTVTPGARDQSLIRANDEIAVSRADVHPISLHAINLQVALDHAAAGMPVFPVRVLRGPNGKWQKRPAITGWRQAASLDLSEIGRWWSEFPEALPGIELGRSGLFVVDADRHDSNADGVRAFVTLRASYADDSPHPKTLTAGMGEHHFYRQPAGQLLGNSEGSLPPGIDVRGAGGFVMAPGAVRPDGAIWEPMREAAGLTEAFRAGAIPEVPDWLLTILAAKRRQAPHRLSEIDLVPRGREEAYATASLEAGIAELGGTRPGERNNKLNSVAYHLGRMVGQGWIDRHLVVSRLLAASDSNRLIEDDGADSVATQSSLACRPASLILVTIYQY